MGLDLNLVDRIVVEWKKPHVSQFAKSDSFGFSPDTIRGDVFLASGRDVWGAFNVAGRLKFGKLDFIKQYEHGTTWLYSMSKIHEEFEFYSGTLVGLGNDGEESGQASGRIIMREPALVKTD